MEKKLTSQGPKKRQSYTVTLPKEWIKKQGLDKTKEIDLELTGDKIIISPYKKADKKIEIKADEYNHTIKKILSGLYRLGIDEIKFKINKEELIEEIYSIINERLIGYEVIEHKGDEILVKYITKESDEDFKVVLRRIYLLTLELAETKSSIKNKNLDKNIQRLCNYCQRILIKKGHIEILKVPFYYLFIDQIEKISNELTWLNEQKISKKQEEAKKRINVLLNKSYELFYKFNSIDYNHYCEESFKLKNEIKLDGKVDIATIHLYNLARSINSLFGTIFDISFYKDQ
jgi:antitoxin component of MazEF toxin-antitoxin module